MIITNISIEQTSTYTWTVRGDTERFGPGEILAQVGTEEEAHRYILKEAVDVIRHIDDVIPRAQRFVRQHIGEDALAMIAGHLPEKKAEVLRKKLSYCFEHGWDGPEGCLWSTPHGMYIDLDNLSRASFTCYITCDGRVTRKPAKEETEFACDARYSVYTEVG